MAESDVRPKLWVVWSVSIAISASWVTGVYVLALCAKGRAGLAVTEVDIIELTAGEAPTRFVFGNMAEEKVGVDVVVDIFAIGTTVAVASGPTGAVVSVLFFIILWRFFGGSLGAVGSVVPSGFAFRIYDLLGFSGWAGFPS